MRPEVIYLLSPTSDSKGRANRRGAAYIDANVNPHSKSKAKAMLPQQRGGRQILSVSPEREAAEADAKLKDFTPRLSTWLLIGLGTKTSHFQNPPTLRPSLNPPSVTFLFGQSGFYFAVASPDVEGLDSEASGTKGSRLHMS